MRFFSAPAWIFAAICVAAPAIAKAANLRAGVSAAGTVPACVEGDPAAIYRMKAGCTENVRRGRSEAVATYNREGLRDHDYPPRPKPGWRRILFVGPSALAAPGLSLRDSPVKQFEARLRKTGVKAEVINGGVEGYSLAHFVVKIPQLLEAYHPDHLFVLASFGPGAVMDHVLEKDLEWKDGKPVRLGLAAKDFIWSTPLLPKEARIWLLTNQWADNLHTFLYMWRRWWQAWSCGWFAEDSPRRLACGLSSSIALLQQIHAEAKSRGVPMHVLFLPNEHMENLLIYPPNWVNYVVARAEPYVPVLKLPGQHVGALLEEAGLPAIQIRGGLGTLSLYEDHHFNASGARLFGEDVAERTRHFFNSNE